MIAYRVGSVGLGILALVAGLGCGARQESKNKANTLPTNQSLPTRASIVGQNIQSVEETQIQPPGGGPPVKAVVIQGCIDADKEWQIPVHAGQNYVVQANKDGAACNGWTAYTNVGPQGPEGQHAAQESGGIDPTSRSVALIASVSDYGQYAEEAYDWQQKKGVAEAYRHPLYVGPSRQDMANISGMLHLTMNAPIVYSPGVGGAKRAGSIKVWLQIWP